MRERGEEREREGGPSVRGERRKFNKTKCTYSPKTSDSTLSQRKDKRNKILIKKTVWRWVGGRVRRGRRVRTVTLGGFLFSSSGCKSSTHLNAVEGPFSPHKRADGSTYF